MRLKDKVILVTGSTTGIGEGMVRLFAQEGAKVVVHGTREDSAQKLAAEIGTQACFTTGDLEDPQTPAALVADSIRHFGRLDCLVNNAASTSRGSLETTDAQAWDRIFAVNLRAPFLLIQAALPSFRKQGGGSVLNIGSINAYCGEPNLLAYSASKGGLMTLTRNLADAHAAEGIRVNQLNVGWTVTPNEVALKMREGLPSDWPARVSKAVAPFGRLFFPLDIAWAATYFLSDEAALLNGAILDMDQYPSVGRNPAKSTTNTLA
jgi:NAD(P)-dependent dehydrogenase (short-subunit alcohol dehydrogenase family)